MKMWQGRFKKEEDERVNDFNSSISFDSRMYKQDITGSIAHARMLGKTGIIEESESEKIVEGLKGILHDIESGNLEFDSKAEMRSYGVPVPDYADLNVSGKVVKIIRSYTGIVDKFVWRK